jgi:hypothetical protein
VEDSTQDYENESPRGNVNVIISEHKKEKGIYDKTEDQCPPQKTHRITALFNEHIPEGVDEGGCDD